MVNKIAVLVSVLITLVGAGAGIMLTTDGADPRGLIYTIITFIGTFYALKKMYALGVFHGQGMLPRHVSSFRKERSDDEPLDVIYKSR